MSFTQLESGTGPLGLLTNSFNEFGKVVTYGINCYVEFVATSCGFTTGKRPGAFFSNKAMLYGATDCELVNDVTVHDGINALIIDGETGVPNVDKVLAAVEPIIGWTRERAHNMAYDMATKPEDNTVALLYNMLRMYYIKRLGESETGSQTIRPTDSFYDDGHVAITYRTALGLSAEYNPAAFELTRTSALVAMGNNHHFRFRQDNSPPMMNLTDLTPAEASVLRYALAEWSEESPLRIMHKSPELAPAVAFFAGQTEANMQDQPTYGELDANDVLQAIMRIVHNNRLMAHFDMAYAIVAQVMFTHMPRSAEAHWWLKKRTVVKLPKFRCYRGICDVFTLGSAYISDVTRWATFKNWQENPMRLPVHSIALSEITHAQEFEYLCAKNRSEFPAAYIGTTPSHHCGLAWDYHLFAMRMKTKVTLPWPTLCGLYRFSGLHKDSTGVRIIVDMLDELARNEYNVSTVEIDGEVRDVISIKEVVPYCYPVLSMGTSPSDYYLNELKSTSELVRDGEWYVTQSSREMNKFMGIMRIMGYDVQCEHMPTGRQYHNWAANTNGHYMPSIIDNQMGRFEYFRTRPSWIHERGHLWNKMPNFGDKLIVTMTTHVKRYKILIDNQPYDPIGPLTTVYKADVKSVTSVMEVKRSITLPQTIDWVRLTEFANFQLAQATDMTILGHVVGAGL